MACRPNIFDILIKLSIKTRILNLPLPIFLSFPTYRQPHEASKNGIDKSPIAGRLSMKKIFRFKRRQPSLLWRVKWFLVLITIGCMEILPIPVTDSILIFVLIYRPLWFKNVIDKLYSHLSDSAVDDADLSYFSKYQLDHPKHFEKRP